MEKTSIEGASQEPLLPRNLREPGLREAAGRAAFDVDYKSVEREFNCVFHLILKKITIEECAVRQIIAEVQATSWRLLECIRVRELAATHRLG